MGCRATATIKDLESTIIEAVEQAVEEENEAENDTLRSQNIEENPTSSVEKESTSVPKATSVSFWLPQIGEFVSVLLEDGC